MAKLIIFLRDHSRVLKWLFFAFLIFAVGFDIFFTERHAPHFWGDPIRGFWSVFGAFGCLGMIVVCKGIYHAWLMQDEDYYDK